MSPVLAGIPAPAPTTPPTGISATTAAATNPAPSSGPTKINNDTIRMTMPGLTAKEQETAPTIDIAVRSEYGIETIEFTFEGTRQAIFKPDGSIQGYEGGRTAALTLEIPIAGSTSVQIEKDRQEAAAVIDMFKAACAALKSSGGKESGYESAHQLLRAAIERLHKQGNGALVTEVPDREITDPRLLAVIDVTKHTANASEMEIADSKGFLDEPHVLIPNLLTGTEILTVKSKKPGNEGNVYSTTFTVSPFGIDIQQTNAPLGMFPKEKRTAQVLAARLEGSELFNPGNQSSVRREIGTILRAALGSSGGLASQGSVLPRTELAQTDTSLFSSGAAQALASLGAMTYAKNIVVNGPGHINERFDPRGAKLENVTIAKGVAYFNGKFAPGSTVTVGPDAVLYVDAEMGSTLKLIVLPGGKVMAGPLGLGLAGCKVSGQFNGDLSGIDLKDIEWGTNLAGQKLTWKDFEGMIYDDQRCDDDARDIFHAYSSEYEPGLAGLMQVDKQNFKASDMRALLAKNFPVVDVAGGFIVEGHVPHRGTFVKEIQDPKDPAATNMEVVHLALPDGNRVADLDETKINKWGNRIVLDTPHQALLEVLRRRASYSAPRAASTASSKTPSNAPAATTASVPVTGNAIRQVTHP